MVRLRPYRTVEDRIDGVVLTFVDITDRLLAEKKLSESESSAAFAGEGLLPGVVSHEPTMDRGCAGGCCPRCCRTHARTARRGIRRTTPTASLGRRRPGWAVRGLANGCASLRAPNAGGSGCEGEAGRPARRGAGGRPGSEDARHTSEVGPINGSATRRSAAGSPAARCPAAPAVARPAPRAGRSSPGRASRGSAGRRRPPGSRPGAASSARGP